MKKHTYTDPQIHSPGGVGEMSSSQPLFEIFSPKKEMETCSCMGEGAGGSGREKCGRQKERRKGRMFTSGVAPWHFRRRAGGGVGGSTNTQTPLDLLEDKNK